LHDHLTATESKQGFLFDDRTHTGHKSPARYFQTAADAVPAIDQDSIPEAGRQGLV
jgi:hypothetical protein